MDRLSEGIIVESECIEKVYSPAGYFTTEKMPPVKYRVKALGEYVK